MFNNLDFEEIVKTEFDCLISKHGFSSKIEKEQWLHKVIFTKDDFKIRVQIGDKDLYFNVLVLNKNLTKNFPLWAICKAESVDFGPVSGPYVDNNHIHILASNSSEAIQFLLPKMSNYGRTQKRKIQRVVDKKFKKSTYQIHY